jgi:hypothetical protein
MGWYQSPKSPNPDLSYMPSKNVSCPYEHLIIGDFGVCIVLSHPWKVLHNAHAHSTVCSIFQNLRLGTLDLRLRLEGRWTCNYEMNNTWILANWQWCRLGRCAMMRVVIFWPIEYKNRYRISTGVDSVDVRWCMLLWFSGQENTKEDIAHDQPFGIGRCAIWVLWFYGQELQQQISYIDQPFGINRFTTWYLALLTRPGVDILRRPTVR